MQKLLIATIAAIFVATCLGQDECPTGVVPYIANTFDALRFSFATGYHDMTNFRSLFVDTSDSSAWILFDFVNGQVTYNDTSGCSQYSNNGLSLLTSTMEPSFLVDKFGGSVGKGSGYTIKQHGVTIRGVLDLGRCVELFTYIGVRGKPYTTLIRDEVRTDNVNDEIRSNVDPIVEFIAGGSCRATRLPY